MWRKIIAFLFDSVYQVVTWVWIGISISAFFFFASNKSKTGMILSAVGLVAAILVMLSLMAKRHFWDGDGDAQRRAPLRPELYTNGAMGPLIPGQPETVLVGFKNRGNATARNICLGGGNHIFTTPDFAGPLVYKQVPVQVRPDLGPGNEEQSVISKSPQPLSQAQINQLGKSEVLFFHFAEGEYNDDSGNAYPIDYCYMFNPMSPTIMRVCPEKYWPKSRTDRRGVATLDLLASMAAKSNATQDNPAMNDNEKPKTTNTTINRSIVNSPGASGNVLGDVSIHHHAPPPRLVTVAQANKMIAELRPHSGSTLAIVWLSNNNESFKYADSIARVFQSAGWQVEEVGAFSGTAIGVGVVCEGKLPIAEASAVVAAFREAELQIKERTVPGWPEGKWRLVVGEKP